MPDYRRIRRLGPGPQSFSGRQLQQQKPFGSCLTFLKFSSPAGESQQLKQQPQLSYPAGEPQQLKQQPQLGHPAGGSQQLQPQPQWTQCHDSWR